MFRATVVVGNKKGVADPEGKNIAKTLHLLGFDNVSDVRSAKQYSIYLQAESKEEARKKVEEMCRKLLANPVIHNYSIEIEEVGEE